MYFIVNKSFALLRLSGLGVKGKDSEDCLNDQWATQRCVLGDTLPEGYGYGAACHFFWSLMIADLIVSTDAATCLIAEQHLPL